ncbi:MAG TPA: hypothetical protein VKU89_05595 [Solirubrobacteraceae bacterium]|nr:hypothetical protein [Solirubrobacteraceae bacterium]
MSHNELDNILIACAAVLALAAFVWLILVPAVGSYARTWERLVVAFLSLYVFAVLVAIGAIGALVAIYFAT